MGSCDMIYIFDDYLIDCKNVINYYYFDLFFNEDNYYHIES